MGKNNRKEHIADKVLELIVFLVFAALAVLALMLALCYFYNVPFDLTHLFN